MTLEESQDLCKKRIKPFNFTPDQIAITLIIHDNSYLHGVTEGLRLGQEVIDIFIESKTENLKKEKE
jgi:hypothetical protein